MPLEKPVLLLKGVDPQLRWDLQLKGWFYISWAPSHWNSVCTLTVSAHALLCLGKSMAPSWTGSCCWWFIRGRRGAEERSPWLGSWQMVSERIPQYLLLNSQHTLKGRPRTWLRSLWLYIYFLVNIWIPPPIDLLHIQALALHCSMQKE